MKLEPEHAIPITESACDHVEKMFKHGVYTRTPTYISFVLDYVILSTTLCEYSNKDEFFNAAYKVAKRRYDGYKPEAE